MFVDPVHSQGTPIHENDRQGLAGGSNTFNKLFFRLRKIDAGAISAEESRFVDRHLFALKLAGDSNHGDDGIGILRRRNCLRRNPIYRLGPNQFRMRRAVSGSVRDLEPDLVSLLKVDTTYARCESARATAESRRYLLAINYQPPESLAAHAKEEIARLRGGEKS